MNAMSKSKMCLPSNDDDDDREGVMSFLSHKRRRSERCKTDHKMPSGAAEIDQGWVSGLGIFIFVSFWSRLGLVGLRFAFFVVCR